MAGNEPVGGQWNFDADNRAGFDARGPGRLPPPRSFPPDAITREVLQTVRRTFLTPFDRSAITDLIASMDDAIDEMQKTAGAVDLYDVTQFEPEMRDIDSRSPAAAFADASGHSPD